MNPMVESVKKSPTKQTQVVIHHWILKHSTVDLGRFVARACLDLSSCVLAWNFRKCRGKALVTWRIIPWLGYVVSNHGDVSKSPRPGVVGPLPNGLFMAFKWGWSWLLTSPGMILQVCLDLFGSLGPTAVWNDPPDPSCMVWMCVAFLFKVGYFWDLKK